MGYYKCKVCGNVFRSIAKEKRCTNPECRSRRVKRISEFEYKEEIRRKKKVLDTVKEEEEYTAEEKEDWRLDIFAPTHLVDWFLFVLEGAGIEDEEKRRKITLLFFNGNYDKPEWLNEVLNIYQVPENIKKIILKAYFGEEKLKRIKTENKEETDHGDFMKNFMKEFKKDAEELIEFERLVRMLQSMRGR